MPTQYTFICERCRAEFESQKRIRRFCSKLCANNSHVTIPAVVRFWSKVDKSGDCWLWLGGCFKSGYGMFTLDSNPTGAHRIAWILTHGPIPDNLYVLHKCDVRNCVNPDHLFLGTHLDNIADMVQKRRHAFGDRNGLRRDPSKCLARAHPERLARGEAHGNSKLTADTVREIRRLHAAKEASSYELSRRYHVTASTIRGVVRRAAWAHLPDES